MALIDSVVVRHVKFDDCNVFISALSCPVLKHSRVSEVFKGFNVHNFEHYGQRNYVLKREFSLGH